MTDVTQVAYPPLDSQATETFIDDSGITKSGDIQTDFKKALYITLQSSLSPDLGESGYSIDDLWRRYTQVVLHADPNKVNNAVTISDPPRGQHPKHTHTLPFLTNPGNANGFPRGSSFHPAAFGMTDAWVETDLVDPIGVAYTGDGSQIICMDHSTNYQFRELTMATAYSALPADLTATVADGNTGRLIADAGKTLVFNGDGTAIFIMGENSMTCNEYTLSTPYDITSIAAATPDDTHTLTISGMTAVKTIQFANEGTYLFVYGSLPTKVARMTCSTPYDLSTATYDGATYDITLATHGVPIANALTFGITADGVWMISPYSGNNGTIAAIKFDTPWDISGGYTAYTTNATAKNYASDGIGACEGVSIHPDGDYFVCQVADTGPDETFQIWKNFGSDAYVTRFAEKQEFNPGGSYDPTAMFWRADGLKFYLQKDSGGNDIQEFDCSTAWDVSTAVLNDVQAQSDRWRGIFFHPDGDEVWLADGINDTVEKATLSVAWDVTTIGTPAAVSIPAGPTMGGTRNIWFNSDGTQFYMMNSDFDVIDQLTLSTPYDISTGSNHEQLDLSTDIGTETAWCFNLDGTKLLVADDVPAFGAQNAIRQFNLGTAYDISTATATEQYLHFSAGNGVIQELVVGYDTDNSQEKLYYTVSTTADRVREYDLLSID